MNARAPHVPATLLVVMLSSVAPLSAQSFRSEAEPQVSGPDRGRGALWGAGIGLVAGGLLGGLTVRSETDSELGGSLAESAATGEAVILGALVGAGIGALLGATVLAPGRAVESASDQSGALRVTPLVSLHGFGVRVRVRGVPSWLGS